MSLQQYPMEKRQVSKRIESTSVLVLVKLNKVLQFAADDRDDRVEGLCAVQYHMSMLAAHVVTGEKVMAGVSVGSYC